LFVNVFINKKRRNKKNRKNAFLSIKQTLKTFFLHLCMRVRVIVNVHTPLTVAVAREIGHVQAWSWCVVWRLVGKLACV